jgi:hypothetical protein
MISTRIASRAAILVLWALALWHAWIARGLFVDGAKLLLDIVLHQNYVLFRAPRFYCEAGRQILAVLGVGAGITDLHLLAQLLSLSMFAVPTAFYHLALWRARDEPVLLAATLAVIAMVFMTTSFFIAGEYNACYAIATASGVWLATTDRLRIGEGAALAAIAVVFSRSYEATLYLGPLLAFMTLWRIRNVPDRPPVATSLHLAAAAFFLGGGIVAVESLIDPFDPGHLRQTYDEAPNFWQNPQFDVIFAAVLVVVVWATVNPAGLRGRKPYLWASILLALLALSPLMALTDTVVRPLARSHYVARTISGPIVFAVVAFVWLYASGRPRQLAPLVLLRQAEVARPFLAFACLLLVAVLPGEVFLTVTWGEYLDALRSTVRARSGVVALEDTALAHRPLNFMVENWALPSQSLVVREKPGDAVIAPSRKFRDWIPFPPEKAPDLGPYVWHE